LQAEKYYLEREIVHPFCHSDTLGAPQILNFPQADRMQEHILPQLPKVFSDKVYVPKNKFRIWAGRA